MSFVTATFDDIAVIRAIAYECWPVAYSNIISTEQIKYMLDKMYSESSLKSQMEEEGCEFILIQVDDKPLGFASYSVNKNHTSKLHKLYLLSNTKGKGYGKCLLEEVKRRVLLKGSKTLELQVNKNNPAIDFYRHAGFMIKEEMVVDIGNGFAMDDYLMSFKLK